jgi:hypothetical protein
MDQLDRMGWTVEDGDTDVPYLSGGRNSFQEVLLREHLRDDLRRINRAGGARPASTRHCLIKRLYKRFAQASGPSGPFCHASTPL